MRIREKNPVWAGARVFPLHGKTNIGLKPRGRFCETQKLSSAILLFKPDRGSIRKISLQDVGKVVVGRLADDIDLVLTNQGENNFLLANHADRPIEVIIGDNRQNVPAERDLRFSVAQGQDISIEYFPPRSSNKIALTLHTAGGDIINMLPFIFPPLVPGNIEPAPKLRVWEKETGWQYVSAESVRSRVLYKRFRSTTFEPYRVEQRFYKELRTVAKKLAYGGLVVLAGSAAALLFVPAIASVSVLGVCGLFILWGVYQLWRIVKRGVAALFSLEGLQKLPAGQIHLLLQQIKEIDGNEQAEQAAQLFIERDPDKTLEIWQAHPDDYALYAIPEYPHYYLRVL